jgi:hypothetical protein
MLTDEFLVMCNSGLYDSIRVKRIPTIKKISDELSNEIKLLLPSEKRKRDRNMVRDYESP